MISQRERQREVFSPYSESTLKWFPLRPSHHWIVSPIFHFIRRQRRLYRLFGEIISAFSSVHIPPNKYYFMHLYLPWQNKHTVYLPSTVLYTMFCAYCVFLHVIHFLCKPHDQQHRFGTHQQAFILTFVYAPSILQYTFQPNHSITYTVKKGSRVSRPQPGCHYQTLPGRE